MFLGMGFGSYSVMANHKILFFQPLHINSIDYIFRFIFYPTPHVFYVKGLSSQLV